MWPVVILSFALNTSQVPCGLGVFTLTPVCVFAHGVSHSVEVRCGPTMKGYCMLLVLLLGSFLVWVSSLAPALAAVGGCAKRHRCLCIFLPLPFSSRAAPLLFASLLAQHPQTKQSENERTATRSAGADGEETHSDKEPKALTKKWRGATQSPAPQEDNESTCSIRRSTCSFITSCQFMHILS